MKGKIEVQTIKESVIEDLTFSDNDGVFSFANIGSLSISSDLVVNQIEMTANLFFDCDQNPDIDPLLMKQEDKEWVPVWTRKSV